MNAALDPRQLLVGLVLALVVAGSAYRLRWLTFGGFGAAVVVGTAVFGFGGLLWALTFLTFYFSSMALSRWRWEQKRGATAKGARRDEAQVLANGAVAAAAAVAYGVSGNSVLFAGFLGALAAATADTWATEVGMLSGVAPRMLTTGRPVQPGTSGAVTALGSAAAAAGAIFIGLVAAVLVAAGSLLRGDGPDLTGLRFVLLAPTAGLAGATLDSWLGATWQAVRRCPVCEKETELAMHCGSPTRLIRGKPWLGGDLVNLAASLAGAVVALLLEVLVFG